MKISRLLRISIVVRQRNKHSVRLTVNSGPVMIIIIIFIEMVRFRTALGLDVRVFHLFRRGTQLIYRLPLNLIIFRVPSDGFCFRHYPIVCVCVCSYFL